MSVLENYSNTKPNNIINLLSEQLTTKSNNTKVSECFNYNKPEIKSGLEDVLEGNVSMPFGGEILLLQSEALKAGPEEYDKFLKRHLNRSTTKKWELRTIDFS